MKMSDRRRIYTGSACINPSPPAVAHFAATRLPAYDCPEGYPAPQVKIVIRAFHLTPCTSTREYLPRLRPEPGRSVDGLLPDDEGGDRPLLQPRPQVTHQVPEWPSHLWYTLFQPHIGDLGVPNGYFGLWHREIGTPVHFQHGLNLGLNKVF